MIKQIKQYAKEKNLTIDTKGNLIYGNYNSRFISIWESAGNQSAHMVKIWVRADDPVTADTIQSYLQQLPGKVTFLKNVSYDGRVITAVFQAQGIGWAKKYIPAVDGFLRDVTNFCMSYAVSLGCEFCGTPDDLMLYQLNSVPHLICPDCLNQVGQQAEQKKADFKAQGQGNVLFGIVGSILGSLLGVLIWVIIYELGYISAIGAVILVVCAFKGYELLGGRMTKLGIAISCIVSVLMILFAEQIGLALEIYDYYHVEEGITFFDAFRAVPYFLQDPELFKAVLPDILVGVGSVLAGSVAMGVQLYKEKTGAIAKRMVAHISGK